VEPQIGSDSQNDYIVPAYNFKVITLSFHLRNERKISYDRSAYNTDVSIFYAIFCNLILST